MAFVKVNEDYVNMMVNYLESAVEAQKSSLELWKANRAMMWAGKDVYANRQNQSIISDSGKIPDVVKSPCRFATREEIQALYNQSLIQTEIYQMFLDAIDNGDFLMVDDDPDDRGYPGYQLFKKDRPSIDVLQGVRV